MEIVEKNIEAMLHELAKLKEERELLMQLNPEELSDEDQGRLEQLEKEIAKLEQNF